jgi:hypothetical protein
MKRFLRFAALALRKLARAGSPCSSEARVGWKGERKGDACPPTPGASPFDTLVDIDLTSAAAATLPCLAEPSTAGSGRAG